MALITNPLLPMNSLEAVNLCLQYMREPPIDDLALINTSYAVENCWRHLMMQSRDLQKRGWAFNHYDRSYTPVAGAITVPLNVVSVTGDPDDTRFEDAPLPMLRGAGKVINARTGSLTGWGTLPLTFTITELLDFEELPECAKTVIALNAAVLVGEQAGEGIELSPYHQTSLLNATAELMDYELGVAPINFYSTLDNRR